jgi:hypothetical protein
LSLKELLMDRFNKFQARLFARTECQSACEASLFGRKSWPFCGSDRGGRPAAAMYSLIVTSKMKGVDPQAWLTDTRIVGHRARPLGELPPPALAVFQ